MEPSRSSFSAVFGLELVNDGGIWLPKILLQNYKSLGLSDCEMMALIHILYFKASGAQKFTVEELSEYMEADTSEVGNIINSLVVKGILNIKTGVSSVDNVEIEKFYVEGLYEKLLETWGCKKALEYESSERSQDYSDSNTKAYIEKLCSCFEKEFGRALTPMERTQISEWYLGRGFSADLILEALKRAVLRGVLNLRYIESILLDWSKNNLSTINEIIAFEENFSQQKTGKSSSTNSANKKVSKARNKYEDLYMS